LYATSGAGSTVEMFSVILAEDLLQKQANIMVIGTYVLDVTVTHHFIRSGNTYSMFSSFILGEREEEG
jgi:hypothetical protein